MRKRHGLQVVANADVSYTITLTVTDDAGHSAGTTFTVVPVLRVRSVSVNLTVHFGPDSATLTRADKRELKRIRPLIRRANRASILGFCASPVELPGNGRDGYALGLSRARAHAVVAFLFAGHVPRSLRLTVAGEGRTQLVATSTLASRRTKNRRVHIQFRYPKPVGTSRSRSRAPLGAGGFSLTSLVHLVGQLSNPPSQSTIRVLEAVRARGRAPTASQLAEPQRLGNGAIQRAAARALAHGQPMKLADIRLAIEERMGHSLDSNALNSALLGSLILS